MENEKFFSLFFFVILLDKKNYAGEKFLRKWQIRSTHSCLKIDLQRFLFADGFKQNALNYITPLISSNDFCYTANTSWWIGVELIQICGRKCVILSRLSSFFFHRKHTREMRKRKRRDTSGWRKWGEEGEGAGKWLIFRQKITAWNWLMW